PPPAGVPATLASRGGCGEGLGVGVHLQTKKERKEKKAPPPPTPPHARSASTLLAGEGSMASPLHYFRSNLIAMLRILAAIPKIAVTALIVLAIVNLLIGVIFRYFVSAFTDYLDLDPIPFTWVEEVGEMSLAWLTLIGTAIGVRQRSHFTLYAFAH